MKDLSLSQFNCILASSAPTPGGGGASALVASLGAGLNVMVGCLTVGKKKYAATDERMKAITAEAQALQAELLDLVEADAEAFEPLSRVYVMPKDDPARPALMEKCLRDAAAVPAKIAELACSVIALADEFADIGSALAISDAGCAAAFAKAALEGAALNVFVNTRLMADREYAESLNSAINAHLANFSPLADKTYNKILRRLS